MLVNLEALLDACLAVEAMFIEDGLTGICNLQRGEGQ